MKWWMKSKAIIGSVIVLASAVAKVVSPDTEIAEAILIIGNALGIIGIRAKQERSTPKE